MSFFFFNDTATTEIYTLSLHDALPIFRHPRHPADGEQAPLELPEADPVYGFLDGQRSRSSAHLSTPPGRARMTARASFWPRRSLYAPQLGSSLSASLPAPTGPHVTCRPPVSSLFSALARRRGLGIPQVFGDGLHRLGLVSLLRRDDPVGLPGQI